MARKPKPQAVAIGDTDLMGRLQAKARELGLDQDPDPADFPRTETEAEAKARAEVRRRHYQARWDARLPVMYRDASLSDVEADDLPREPILWLSNDASPTLILAGPVGTGKTHTAYAIGNTAVARGTWVEAWTVTDLLEQLRPGGDDRVADDVRRCQLLILDDLGSGKATDWAVEQLTALVDARLREGLRQVVTTNHPYATLEEAWGGRLMDRLRYRWTVAQLSGESRRKEAWTIPG